MGEYYVWANPERREYIDPYSFDYGSKLYNSCQRDGFVLRALRDLLKKEWKGCRFFWMGDGAELPEDIAPELFLVFKEHCNECHGYMFDAVCTFYKNMSGLYKGSEKMVTEEINLFLKDIAERKNSEPDKYWMRNEFGINLKNPFDGLFLREGIDAKYIVNYTKKVCYSFEGTKILQENGDENDYADPLPMLMKYGRSTNPGTWLGDVIGVADELPEGITVMDSITLDW